MGQIPLSLFLLKFYLLWFSFSEATSKWKIEIVWLKNKKNEQYSSKLDVCNARYFFVLERSAEVFPKNFDLSLF